MPRPGVPTFDVKHQADGKHAASDPARLSNVNRPGGRGEDPAVARRPRTKQRRSFPRGLTPSNRGGPYFEFLASLRRSPRLRAMRPGPAWVPHIDGYFIVGVDPRR